MANANVVTWTGRSIINQRINGSGTAPINVGWGTGGSQTTSTYVTGSAATDVNLFAASNNEPRASGAVTFANTGSANTLTDTMIVIATLTASQAHTINEVALFDSATSLSPQVTMATLTSGATSASAGATMTQALPPTSNAYYAQIENEVVLVTGNTAGLLTMTRGVLGTTAAAHAANAVLTASGDGGAHAANASAGSAETWIPTGANGGSVFVHADFANIALNTADSIQFTLRTQLA